MEGIEVLSRSIVHIIPTNIMLGYILFTFAPIFIGFIIYFYREKINGLLYSAIGTVIAFSIVTILMAFNVGSKETYNYKVTIDEEVNFQEFNDKFEIISQEGEIFTIKEREIE